MEDLEFAFEIDAGLLVARLHRAACSTHPDCYYFNTGIVNDQDVNPDKSDDITFNFDIKTDQYEVGCLFKKPIIIDVSKLLEELEGGSLASSAPSALLSGSPVPSALPSGSPVPSTLSSGSPTPSTLSSGSPVPSATSAGSSASSSSSSASSGGGPTPSNPAAPIVTEATAAPGAVPSIKPHSNLLDMNTVDLVKRNDFIHILDKVIKQAIEDQKEKMAPPIFDYIKTFTGKTTVKASDLVISYLPKDKMNPYKIKKYDSTVIPYMEPEEVRKMILGKVQQAKTLKQLKKLEFNNICFKVGYSLHIAD